MAFNYQVPKLYRTVVDDVISNVRESFLDDGVDDQVLMELKQLWETKLQASKAVEPLAEPQPALTVPRTVQQQAMSGLRQQVVGPGPVPVFAQIPGVSRPQSTIALPAMYSQQFAGQQILHTDQGTIILQTPGAPIIRGQMAGAQIRPLQHVVQQGNQQVTAPTTSGMIQLDGPTDRDATDPPACSRTIEKASIISDKTSETVLKPGVIIVGGLTQCDGQGDSSSDDDDDDDDDDKDEDEERDEEENEGVEEEPLNSDDDVSDEDPTELFDTDNVIVCQYDKINRCKNKWKFGLKDGIMNLNGRDYVFQRASGDAEW